MTISINDINQAIMHGTLTNDQLDSVIMAVKYRRTQIGKQVKRSLAAGASVKFYSSKHGREILGTVTKVNRKFVIVREKTSKGLFVNTNWRVPANMLETV